MSGPSKKFDLGPFIPEGMALKKVEVEAPEDPEEKALRLWKEKLGYLVKDLLAHVLAYLVLAVVASYCGYVVVRYGVVSPEAKAVWPVLTAIIGAAGGLVFGRQLAKP